MNVSEAFSDNPTLLDRFWDRVEQGPDSSCWSWNGTIAGNGYARFQWPNGSPARSIAAHRLAWVLCHKEDVPAGLDLDHLCRNRGCVNPAHLEPVSRSENNRRGRVGKVARLRNLAKTHCPQGHPYDEANTFRQTSGARGCRACRAAITARWRQRQKADA